MVHGHTVLTVHVAEHTITVDLDDSGRRTFRRTTAQPVRNAMAQERPPALRVLTRVSNIR